MMKKLNDTSFGVWVLLLACINLCSCSNDKDDYPDDYVGFDRSTQTVECNNNEAESEFQISIIAAKKSKEDRAVVLSLPPVSAGQNAVMTLTESKVIIKAGKKSVKTTVKIFPKRMILQQQHVTLTCTPQWKDGKVSNYSILLKQK